MEVETLKMRGPKLAYSVDEAAELLSICRRTCYELMTSGRLRSVKLGRRRLVRHSDLVCFVESLGDRDELAA